MTLRENAAPCNIREQIIEDDASGLTFQFEVKKGIHKGQTVDETVMRIFGKSLPFGNREIIFGPDGAEIAAGTSTRGLCKPTWPMEIEP